MSEKKSGSFFVKLATFIVDKRNLFFLLYVFALVFCLFSMNWVEVENDVTTYLPEDTETRQGIDAMNANFTTFGSARVMVNNITYETAEQIRDMLEAVEGVDMVTFDDTADHYRDTAALFDISFKGVETDEVTLQAMAAIQEALSGYDLYVDTTIGYDENAMLQEEMNTILVVAVIIIILVLVLTSRAYMEVPVLLLTFGAAALMNMGTNYLCGKISFISNSIAVVLQLALAIDYAIILCHRFSDEHEALGAREAAIAALSKAIPEISASSLTTVSGLAALGFMEFAIGMDMAIVLIKAILLSLLSVFTLMPGLLVLFCPLIDRTRHKRLLPNITAVGKFAVKTRRVVPPLFVLILVGAFWLSSQCPYAYSYNDLKTAKMSQRQNAYFKIKDTFGASNMVALVVPSGDYEAESHILKELEACPQVKSTLGLSGIEAMDGYKLTDALTPRELSEVVGMDYEVMQLLYTAYAADHDQYGMILSGMDEYEVPLFDMLLFLKDQLEEYNINLSGDDQQMIDDLFAQLSSAQAQLRNDRYSRMVVYLNLPEESGETFDFLTTIRDIMGKYYDGDYYVVGNSTSSRDLSASFVRDNLMISILSSFFVIVVLLFTFQSAGLPVLLITVILGSVWINFSFPTIMNQALYFLGYLIVQAIQMGANIDYAIVISSHYQEQKKHMPHKEAIVAALNAAFPTVFTSGTILASAGLLIGRLSAQPVVSTMGTCLGRGTIISIFLVLFVLPAFLVLGDSIINRTSFKLKGMEPKARTATGTMRVNGHVRGYISGVVDGDFSGILHGQLNATVSTDGQPTREGPSLEQLTPGQAPGKGGTDHA
ncbi:MMPL family transporter [bacterium]|nr:MMPL family transporter [bacterium]